MVFMVAQLVKNPPAMQETWIQSLGWEDPLEEGMTTHSSILARRIWLPRQGWHLEAWPMRRRSQKKTPSPALGPDRCLCRNRRLPCAHDMFIEENSAPTDLLIPVALLQLETIT